MGLKINLTNNIVLNIDREELDYDEANKYLNGIVQALSQFKSKGMLKASTERGSMEFPIDLGNGIEIIVYTNQMTPLLIKGMNDIVDMFVFNKKVDGRSSGMKKPSTEWVCLTDEEKQERVEFVKANPTMLPQELAKVWGVKVSYVYNFKAKHRDVIYGEKP